VVLGQSLGGHLPLDAACADPGLAGITTHDPHPGAFALLGLAGVDLYRQHGPFLGVISRKQGEGQIAKAPARIGGPAAEIVGVDRGGGDDGVDSVAVHQHVGAITVEQHG